MTKPRKNYRPLESRKSEIRFITDDPKKMLGKWVARRALKTWIEEHQDTETGKIVEIERSEVLLERGTYIDQAMLSTISFMMQEGSLTQVEVSNQNRQGIQLTNTCFFPYKAVARIDDRRRTFLLYATSVANALLILTDYIELNCKGHFTVTKVEEMEYCVVLVDRYKSPDECRYELDSAYLKGDISLEDFAEATCDNIAAGNTDDSGAKDETKDMKFYQIGAHIVLHNEKEGNVEEDHTFIVQTISAVRANMLIEKYLRDRQEERYLESLEHPDRTFVRYDIHSFIEESKIIPIGCFIPLSFSEVYRDD